LSAHPLTITALTDIPEVRPGDDLAQLLIAAIERGGLEPRRQDILVVTQKIVSKAEGRYLALAHVEPSGRARELAAVTGKDARLVEVILSESAEVLRAAPGVIVSATHCGLVLANAGVDQSNLAEDARQRVLLLPEQPDRSALRIRSAWTRISAPISASSSPTAPAGRGGSVRWGSPSAPRGCHRYGTVAARGIWPAARWR
jgi:coenzyme F420-0:L-glutamate ligase/coenzyme F420-1:gamma-L-glutamate ligase